MCLTVPARVARVEGSIAWIADEAGERAISLVALDDIQPGDYVLYHAGIALSRVELDEAREILALLDELAGADEPTEGLGR
jgi:hydrogenase expression/formation protein HypC